VCWGKGKGEGNGVLDDDVTDLTDWIRGGGE